MEEIFDVTDEFDRVVGQATRAEVHRLGLTHRAVHVLAFDGDGRLWVQRRSARKDRCPRMYDSSAAGHLASGESYEACAIREVREEMGLDVIPLYRFKIAACRETDWEHVAVYTCRIKARIRWNTDEIESGGFSRLSSLAAWMDRAPGQFSSGFVKLFREFQRRGGDKKQCGSRHHAATEPVPTTKTVAAW